MQGLRWIGRRKGLSKRKEKTRTGRNVARLGVEEESEEEDSPIA